MSLKLRRHQQWHLDRIRSSRKATSWASQLINETWDLVFQMWDHRNKINNSTTTQQEKNEMKSLCRQVKREFRKGKQGLPNTDHHMLQDKFEVLSQDLPDLRAWVERIDLARSSAARAAIGVCNALRRSQQCMRNWQRGTTPTRTVAATAATTNNNNTNNTNNN